MPSMPQSQRFQHGFTLLELLIAMAIFAMLAVVGWQVFDGLNRAKERAQYHADQLSELQYAYLQIQQDMRQVVPYQASGAMAQTAEAEPLSASDTTGSQANKAFDSPKPIFTLDNNTVSFVRYADPDPRYQTSPTLIRVSYVFDNNQLLRQQFSDLNQGAQAVSLDSILIKEISAGQWQAYLPETSSRYPSSDANKSVEATTNTASLSNQGGSNPLGDEQGSQLLPKGVGLTFSYHDIPLTWKFALNSWPPLNKGNGDKVEP